MSGELTTAQRLRVHAALAGHVTLDLTSDQARDLADRLEQRDAFVASLVAALAKSRSACKMFMAASVLYALALVALVVLQ